MLFLKLSRIPVPVPKNCVTFIGCNFKSRASQVGLRKQKNDTASVKKGIASFLRSGTKATPNLCWVSCATNKGGFFEIKVQTLTTKKNCRGPQTNMPKNVGSIKT